MFYKYADLVETDPLPLQDTKCYKDMKTGVVLHCWLDGLLQVVLSLLQPQNVRKNLL